MKLLRPFDRVICFLSLVKKKNTASKKNKIFFFIIFYKKIDLQWSGNLEKFILCSRNVEKLHIAICAMKNRMENNGKNLV